MSLLVTDPGLAALFASGMAGAVGDAAGLRPAAVKAAAVAAIAVVAAVNMAGVSLGGGLLRALAALKLGLLALIAV